MPGAELLTPQDGARDRGSVAVFTVVFAVAVIFLTALIVDGGNAMNARERAADIAGQAARAAAEDIAPAALRAGNAPGGAFPIDWGTACGYAQQVVQRYGAGLTGTAVAMTACPPRPPARPRLRSPSRSPPGPSSGAACSARSPRPPPGPPRPNAVTLSNKEVLMAPPIPGLRAAGPDQAPDRRGRAGRDARAVVLLAALTVGVPIALVTVVGLPLPHTMPSLSALTSQLDIPRSCGSCRSSSGWPGCSWCGA